MTKEDLIEQAVTFWCDQLRGTPLRNLSQIDAAVVPVMDRILSVANQHRSTLISADELERFRTALRSQLQAHCDQLAQLELRTDYQPMGLLRDVAKQAGLNPSNLLLWPWKVRMQFRDNHIDVTFADGALRLPPPDEAA